MPDESQLFIAKDSRTNEMLQPAPKQDDGPSLTTLIERPAPRQAAAGQPLFQMPALTGAPPRAQDVPPPARVAGPTAPILGPTELSRIIGGAVSRNITGDRGTGPVDVLRTRPVGGADGRIAAGDAGVVQRVTYGAPDFDDKLKSNFDTLKIEGMPANVRISSWIDKEGKFYLWFLNGNDNRKPHYISDQVKFLEINGVPKDLNEFRRDAQAAAGVLKDTIKYGDVKLVEKLAEPNLETLRISGIPANVRMGTGLDQKGFYFYFTDGRDVSSPFYIPGKLKNIELNGNNNNVDTLRVGAVQAFTTANDATKNSMRAIDGTENIWQFGQRMSGLSNEALKALVTGLGDASRNTNDPATHLLATNYMTAAIIRPIIAGFDPNSRTYNVDQNTKDAVDAAYQQAVRTAQVARAERNIYVQLQAERLTYMLQFASGLVGLASKVPGGFEMP
jgi:hypothetical protein